MATFRAHNADGTDLEYAKLRGGGVSMRHDTILRVEYNMSEIYTFRFTIHVHIFHF